MKIYKCLTLVWMVSFVFLITPVLLAENSDQTSVQHNPQIIHEIKHDVSPPLRSIPPAPIKAGVKRVIPNQRIPRPMGKPELDPVIQTWSGAPNIPTPTLNFSGINYPGVDCFCAPPDTNGDVGPSHYVQTVNTGFQVFNKSGGSVLSARAINTLWSGFGGGCQTNNDGDPTVVYDGIANRWVIAQFSVSTTPYLECVAVSTTGDPTGTWNRYAFNYGSTDFPDYPKQAVWPDAYYTTYNIFAGGAVFSGAKVCAMDRARMLSGLSATQQCFNTSSSFGGLLASDLDGATLPPAGSPNFVVGLGTSSTTLAFWKFHVDWTTPANTTFTGPTNITVANYGELCAGFTRGACVPQGGTTQKLESLGDRVMNRAAYRKFSDHESLLVSHSVTAASAGGIRWYELRTPATTPTVFQQGTYAPDASWRWMPSIAMDQSGNIGLGFSVSSSTLNPQIHYTGRLATDALGTMPQGEGTIINGAGSQTGGLARWGDYSGLTVDPSDDCTFWFTTEYIPTNGSFNWNTRIGTFKFPGCGGGGGNVLPTASFTFGCTGLTCNFTDTSTDSDGTIASRSWNFGDGGTSTATNPSHTYGSSGTFAVLLTVTDNGGAQDSDTQNVTVSSGGGGITLSTRGYKVKGLQKADLTWIPSGTTANTDVYRDNVKIVTTSNDGAYTDNINVKGKGTYVYKVCEAGSTTNCSNNSTVTF